MSQSDLIFASIYVAIILALFVIAWRVIETTPAHPGQHAPNTASGRYPTQIVGESHYQPALDQLCGGRTREGHHHECWARLILEDDNPYDSHPVGVEIAGHLVGYLSRPDAVRYRASGLDPDCPALIAGGWDRPSGQGSYGVRLDMVL